MRLRRERGRWGKRLDYGLIGEKKNKTKRGRPSDQAASERETHTLIAEMQTTASFFVFVICRFTPTAQRNRPNRITQIPPHA